MVPRLGPNHKGTNLTGSASAPAPSLIVHDSMETLPLGYLLRRKLLPDGKKDVFLASCMFLLPLRF